MSVRMLLVPGLRSDVQTIQAHKASHHIHGAFKRIGEHRYGAREEPGCKLDSKQHNGSDYHPFLNTYIGLTVYQWVEINADFLYNGLGQTTNSPGSTRHQYSRLFCFGI